MSSRLSESRFTESSLCVAAWNALWSCCAHTVISSIFLLLLLGRNFSLCPFWGSTMSVTHLVSLHCLTHWLPCPGGQTGHTYFSLLLFSLLSLGVTTLGSVLLPPGAWRVSLSCLATRVGKSLVLRFSFKILTYPRIWAMFTNTSSIAKECYFAFLLLPAFLILFFNWYRTRKKRGMLFIGCYVEL